MAQGLTERIEELNRRLATQLSALHLAPTATSCANLLRDGV